MENSMEAPQRTKNRLFLAILFSNTLKDITEGM
jgi:hypothetical protein